MKNKTMEENLKNTEANAVGNDSNDKGNEAQSPGEVTLTIVKHHRILQLLERPRQMWRMFGFLVCVFVVVVFGLTTVLLVMKEFYPYNTITTSLYGNTTLRNEEKDVTYWLFNSAELWANSGVRVEEGDILTIRASGASNSAIHHLVKDAKDNTTLQNVWTGTEGAKRKDKTTDRDNYRRKFRIAPEEEECILLMQIMPENVNEEYFRDGLGVDSRDRIYVIGKERQNLVARSSGTLRFAVNDIVLTKPVIENMYRSAMRACGIEDSVINLMLEADNEKNAREIALNYADSSAIQLNKKAFGIGYYPGYDDSVMPLFNELLYYKYENFYDAWYVDNIGSFLIVIEHKRAK